MPTVDLMEQTTGPASGHRSPLRWLLAAPAGLLAAYLVVRAIVEFFVIHYSVPASYANDWGGPSLAGVLAVHSGPGLVIVAAAAWWVLRRRRRIP
jgi:hypothetical protein